MSKKKDESTFESIRLFTIDMVDLYDNCDDMEEDYMEEDNMEENNIEENIMECKLISDNDDIHCEKKHESLQKKSQLNNDKNCDSKNDVNVNSKRKSYKQKKLEKLEHKQQKDKLFYDYFVKDFPTSVLINTDEQLSQNLYQDDYFFEAFGAGLKFYYWGEWKNSVKIFQKCQKIKRNDQPCKKLLDYMIKRDQTAPEDWVGKREI